MAGWGRLVLHTLQRTVVAEVAWNLKLPLEGNPARVGHMREEDHSLVAEVLEMFLVGAEQLPQEVGMLAVWRNQAGVCRVVAEMVAVVVEGTQAAGEGEVVGEGKQAAVVVGEVQQAAVVVGEGKQAAAGEVVAGEGKQAAAGEVVAGEGKQAAVGEVVAGEGKQAAAGEVVVECTEAEVAVVAEVVGSHEEMVQGQPVERMYRQ